LTPPTPERLSALDLAEGLQLAHAVTALLELGVLASLAKPRTAEAVAAERRVDAVMLRGVLEYLAARTSLIVKRGQRFVAAVDGQGRFLLELYAMAFGGNAVQLASILRRPARAADAVDREHHARAFADAGAQVGALPSLIRQLGLERVLDLGCGPAAMLVDLAEHDPSFVGWGLERNPAMIRVARRNLRAAGAGKRVRILEGDAFRLAAALPRAIAAEVQTVTASQFVNELFGRGTARAIQWLRGLRRALPGRTLLIADYYGRLGTDIEAPRELLLHDYAQLISGQGVPPPDLDGWNAVYTAAGCRLAHALQDSRTTLFIHVVVLGA
jgi:SAM-dependent methyltransferase